MNSITDFLLVQIVNYGAPLFGLTLFLGALGVPMGASIAVIAMGAFVQQGYFSGIEMYIVGLIGAVLGDTFSFGMGYFAKGWAERRFGNSPSWKSARDSFQQRGGQAVYLTRFLVTALAIPTNLIAGGSGYQFSSFIVPDVAGEVTWIVLYGGLGYFCESRWEQISQIVNNFGYFLLGTIILATGIWLWARKLRKDQFQ